MLSLLLYPRAGTNSRFLMPIVIDADSASSLAAGRCPTSRRIIRWVKEGGIVHSGGRLQHELGMTPLKNLLAAWSAAGRLVLFPAADVVREINAFRDLARSNDVHVIAVVRIGGAKVIVTGDNALKSDLKDSEVSLSKRKIISCNQGHFSELRVVNALLKAYA